MFTTPTPTNEAKGSTADSATEWKLSFVAALKGHQSDPNTDFEIVSGDSTFKVHRLVASLHSGYFKRLCAPTSAFKESSEARVVLQDDPPLAVKMMVDYFYTFDYPDPLSAVPAPDAATTTTARPRNAFEAHSHVFTLADKYDVPGLCELAYAKFIAAMKPTLGYTHTFCSELAANLLLAIPHVYANAPPQDDRLRKAVLAPWKADSLKLLKYVDAVALEEVVRAEPGFAVELLAGIAGVEIGELCEGGKGDAEGKGGKDGEKTVGFAVDLPRNLFFGGGAASST